jgi:heme exporter protein A
MFGATPALRGVTARFEAGTITMLEGPNGAGKSTLLSVIGTVLRPTSGSVWYEPFGEEVDVARAHIGWVAHESHCYRELTGRQNVALAARLYGVDAKEAWDRVCERVGAHAFGDRSVATLSRGQKQRIALARALVHQPSVLLLDEPYSGLDAASAERLERVLMEERDRGALVVVVSHSRGLGERVGGRRLRLEQGRVAKPEA